MLYCNQQFLLSFLNLGSLWKTEEFSRKKRRNPPGPLAYGKQTKPQHRQIN